MGAGLGYPALAILVGLAIVAAGTVSAGAVLSGGVGYLTNVLPLPPFAAIFLLGAALTFVACIGVLESLALIAVFTLIELAGLDGSAGQRLGRARAHLLARCDPGCGPGVFCIHRL